MYVCMYIYVYIYIYIYILYRIVAKTAIPVSLQHVTAMDRENTGPGRELAFIVLE